jgi:hypothetical protein
MAGMVKKLHNSVVAMLPGESIPDARVPNRAGTEHKWNPK